MATLVFGALGTLVGGPIGGALGTLIGREVDRQVLGSPSREGPRLTELAVSSSSYGQPIARQFGHVRSGGTIIWATELREASEHSGGGKGSPATTSYSYSVSLAIAVSSRPIGGVGRIWADGNLLRGAAGDLKTGGSLRVYAGCEDQSRDPLLAAALGEQCPAHRGLAYVVFEDLQLADFGNRIPALSFELLPAGEAALIAALAEPGGEILALPLAHEPLLTGYSHDGGSIAETLALLGQVLPMVVDAEGETLAIGPPRDGASAVPLGAASAWPDGDFGAMSGVEAARAGGTERLESLRYYDPARDFQPGLQRAGGRAEPNGGRTLELPATLAASAAGLLIRQAGVRQQANADGLRYRVTEIDSAIRPGRIVSVPERTGLWRVTSWEWREGGIELELLRYLALDAATPARDAGSAWLPPDRPIAQATLDAFELPYDGFGSSDIARVYAAVGASDGRWPGASLFVERGTALVTLTTSGPRPAIAGRLVEALGPSPALIFEPQASVTLEVDRGDSVFEPATLTELANGANRLLIGQEIVQFVDAEQIAGRRWRLGGLLRGRGASEAEARAGHPGGQRAILLDARLTALDQSRFDPASERIAALGPGAADPIYAVVDGAGRSLRPLSPVHATAALRSDGSLALGWTRRARGAWAWPDEVDAPLVEQSELYEVGIGDPAAPVASWLIDSAQFVIAADAVAGRSGQPAWVRQVGSHGKSPPLELTLIP